MKENNIEEDVMPQEAFNELIDNFEVVATLTMYGRKSIKHYVKEMQAELEQKDKEIHKLKQDKLVLKGYHEYLKNLNKEKDKRIQELEEESESKMKAYEECYCNYKHYKQFESIPKQVVIDKIKELKLSGGSDGKDNVENLVRELTIDILQELLEGEK